MLRVLIRAGPGARLRGRELRVNFTRMILFTRALKLLVEARLLLIGATSPAGSSPEGWVYSLTEGGRYAAEFGHYEAELVRGEDKKIVGTVALAVQPWPAKAQNRKVMKGAASTKKIP